VLSTLAAFWLSYAHLEEVASTYGLSTSPARAFAWPATLDLFIVAGELLMLRAAVLRSGVDSWAVGLTVVGSTGSIALNVAGVGVNAPLLNYVVAAVPPTAALLAFGALMRQVHTILEGETSTESPQVSEPEAVLEDIIEVPEVLEEPKPSSQDVRTIIEKAYTEGLSVREAAKLAGRSPSRVHTVYAQLRKAGQLSRSGEDTG